MDKNREFFTSDPEQGDLLRGLEQMEPEYIAGNAPDLDIRDRLRLEIKDLLTRAKKKGLSRERIVERMNLCFPDRDENDKITKRQIDGWLAASAEDRTFPLEVLPAFIWAIRGDLTALTVVTDALGLHLMDEQEAMAAQLGETIISKTRAAKQERLLRQKLGA